MNKKTIGQFIAVLRKANGMTQQELADKLGVSNKAVSRWERDECAPDLSVIPVIAELFDVTCDELLKGERIINEETSDKVNVKTTKQVKHLLKKALSKFKNMILISIGIAVAGYIVMLGVSYGFFRPDIGFPIMLLFEVVAVIMTAIFLNKAKENCNDNDIFEDMEQVQINNYNSVIGKYSFGSLYVALTAVIFSIPLVMTKSMYIQAVLSKVSYLPLVLLSSIVLGAVYFLIKSPIEKLLSGVKTESGFRDKKELVIMNVIQIGSLLLLLICGYVEFYLEVNYELSPIIVVIVSIAFLIINIAAYVVFLIKFKEKRNVLAVSGARNVLLIIPTVMAGSGVTLIVSSNISMYLDWGNVFGAILVALALFVIARIVQIRVDFKGK